MNTTQNSSRGIPAKTARRIARESAKEPEYASVVEFVEYMLDDERTAFTADDLNKLNKYTGTATRLLRRELEGYGLEFNGIEKPRPFRGVKTSSNDRWFGPGSDAC